jgi:hypothetical protein
MLSGFPRTRCHTTRTARDSSVLNITSDWTYNRLCGCPHKRFDGRGLVRGNLRHRPALDPTDPLRDRRLAG